MIVDDLGITVPIGRDSDAVVYWPEVRHLVLVPVVTPDRQKQPVPAEVYHVLTAPNAEPIELGRFAIDDGTPHIFSSAREKADIRAAVALAMQRTRLPLVADSDALHQRERLLAAETVTRRRRLWYWSLSLVTAAFLGIAVFIPIHDATLPSYRPVTGQVAV